MALEVSKYRADTFVFFLDALNWTVRNTVSDMEERILAYGSTDFIYRFCFTIASSILYNGRIE